MVKREQLTASELEKRIEVRIGGRLDADDRITDRYVFDFGLMPTREWAQMDTTEGPWFGMWTQPGARRIVIYQEGEIEIVDCETDAEYVAELDEIAATHRRAGKWKWIDAGFDGVRDRLIAAGADHLLHPSQRAAA